MLARIKTAIDSQDKLLSVLIWMLIFFYLMDFVGSAIQSLGITETQIGRGVAAQAFHDIFLVFITVAKAGGEALSKRLSDEEPAKTDPPPAP